MKLFIFILFILPFKWHTEIESWRMLALKISQHRLEIWLRRVSSSLALFSDSYLWITLAWNYQLCPGATNCNFQVIESKFSSIDSLHPTFSNDKRIEAKGPTPCLLFILISLSKEVTNEDYGCVKSVSLVLLYNAFQKCLRA